MSDSLQIRFVGHECPNYKFKFPNHPPIFKSLQGRLKTQNLVFRRPFSAKIPLLSNPKQGELSCKLPLLPSPTANLPTDTASAAVSLVKTGCRLIRFLLKSAARQRVRSRLPWCWKTKTRLPPAVLYNWASIGNNHLITHKTIQKSKSRSVQLLQPQKIQ